MSYFVKGNKIFLLVFSTYYVGLLIFISFGLLVRPTVVESLGALIILGLKWPVAFYLLSIVISSFPWRTFPSGRCVLLVKSRVYTGSWAKLAAALCASVSILLLVAPLYLTTDVDSAKPGKYSLEELNEQQQKDKKAIEDIKKQLDSKN